MPRPANGYTNAADQPVPGVHDITGRYGDKRGLMHWIHQEGLKGNANPYGSAADIGTAVHKMCELDLQGAPVRQVEAVPHQMLHIPADIDRAWQSFRAFQQWRRDHQVQAIAFEEAIVSEIFQYGGTFDCIALVDGVRSLIDFKTCKDASRVYLEQRVVMAAHGNLWHEKNPGLPIGAYRLINLPKGGGAPGHFSFAKLDEEWEMFTLQLDCWRIEKGLSRKRTAKAAAKPILTVVETPPDPPEPPKGRRSRKPAEAPKKAPMPSVSMTSITPSQAGAVLRNVPRKRRRVAACSAQFVLPGIISLPPEISPAQLSLLFKEAA